MLAAQIKLKISTIKCELIDTCNGEINSMATDVVCGFCLEQGQKLNDPRILPCNHSYCYPCLVGDFDINKIVRCEKCREVFDVTLDRLPFAIAPIANIEYCDICVEKGKSNGLAVRYCATCTRKMCPDHDLIHQDFHLKHQDVMNFEEYKHNQRKLEIRYCSVHDMPITMACSACYTVLCVGCMGIAPQCADGSAHQPVHLEQLLDLLMKKKDDIKRHAQAKEGFTS